MGITSSKSAATYPTTTEWTSFSEYQAEQEIAEINRQSQLAILQMQQDFDEQLAAIEAASVLPPAPEITTYADVDWSSTIDEMEAEAAADIAELTSWGASSGTITTSPLVWEEEPTVLSPTLLGS